MNDQFVHDIASILEQARQRAKTAVNLSMVYAYYEIGKRIVLEEQQGEQRAAYGQQVLSELSRYLTSQFGKGFSVANLKNIRQFYLVYSNDQIGETVFSQSVNLPIVDNGRKFYLSWSHYLKLMRIENEDERHFYEIEAAKNGWSLSELKRQYNSSLYERLALSTDKDKVYRLALQGQTVETAKDAVKDPYVLDAEGTAVHLSADEGGWSPADHGTGKVIRKKRGCCFEGGSPAAFYCEHNVHMLIDVF